MQGVFPILLVDGGQENRQKVRELLPRCFALREAQTWAEGRDALRTGEFDCVLLGQHLPDATGIEAIPEILGLFGAKAPPIILLTGPEGEETGYEAMHQGAQDFLLVNEMSASMLRRSILHARARHTQVRAGKEIQAELHRSLEKLQLTQQAAGVGYWDWDCGATVMEVSEAHPLLYGLAPARSIELKTWFKALDPRDRLRCLKSMRAMANGGADCELEFRTVWPDGSVHWIACRGKLLTGPAAKPRLTGIAWDITARKQTEEELRVSVSMLTNLNEETTIFAYALAHDLRGPLRSIRTLTQVLGEELGRDAPPRVTETVEQILGGTQRMDNLVQSLGHFMNAGTAPGTPAHAVFLRDAVDDSVKNLRAQMDAAHAVVRCCELPWVRYHKTPIVQLLQNLVENAIKYRRAEVEPEIQVLAVHLEEETRLVVRDNGQGFDDRYAEQIFQPFQRLHGSTLPGSGLGLATCRRIAERFGGRVWAESKPGMGATFYVSFPRQLVIRGLAANR